MSGFKVTRYDIEIKKGKMLPDRDFSFVMISDLHNNLYGKSNETILEAIDRISPEAILVAGDMITAGKHLETKEALKLLQKLARDYPVYYVCGNHESRAEIQTDHYGNALTEYLNQVKQAGVHVIRDACIKTQICGLNFAIWGLDLPRYCYKRFGSKGPGEDYLTQKLGSPDPDCYNILLAHHPCYFNDYALWGPQLTLAGHLHGGIVRLPLLGGLVSPQFALFPHYDRGIYEKNGKKMIVGAGLGSHSIKLRINNPTELIVIDFHKE